MKRLNLILLCLVIVVAASGQEKKKKPSAYNKKKQEQEDEKFLEKQWWLGLKGGANLSTVTVDKTYSIISPTNYEPSTIGKKYDNYKLVGSQVALEVSFYFKRFLISFQPTYQTSRFVYSNTFEWSSDTEQSNHVQLNYKQEQSVNHALLPLIIKYDIYGSRLRPYVQAGVFTAILLDATKTVTASGIDNAAGGENEFKSEPINVGAKDLFARYHWGLMGGVGVNYNLGNHVRLNLDVMYRYGMSNISSTENRYSNDRLAGVGDAMDDLTLDNISVSIGCMFPLRFLQSTLKTLDN